MSGSQGFPRLLVKTQRQTGRWLPLVSRVDTQTDGNSIYDSVYLEEGVSGNVLSNESDLKGVKFPKSYQHCRYFSWSYFLLFLFK